MLNLTASEGEQEALCEHQRDWLSEQKSIVVRSRKETGRGNGKSGQYGKGRTVVTKALPTSPEIKVAKPVKIKGRRSRGLATRDDGQIGKRVGLALLLTFFRSTGTLRATSDKVS
jgi:hypothetical protein